MNRKKLYRVVGGFLASITFITSVLPTFASDRLSSNENDPPETLKTITTSYTYDSLNRLIKQCSISHMSMIPQVN